MFKQTKLKTKDLVWLSVIFWAVVFTALEAPFSFTFNTRLQRWQLWSDAFISFIFIVDLVQNIRNYNRKKQSPQSPQSSWKTIGAFFIDGIACIPFDIIFWAVGAPSTVRIFKVLRMFRLVRVVKILDIFNTLPIIAKKIKMQMYLIWSLVFIHWVSCFWIMLQPIPESISIKSHYIRAFYWAVTTLTTIGYGDITPTTDNARLFTMVIMIAGVGLYGLVIGNISRIFAENARYKEKTREKLEELGFFMKHYHIPERLQQSVFSYYNHVYSKHLSDNDQRIISELPAALKGELQVYMNMKLIRNLPVFKYCSTGCLKAVSAALEQKSFAPGDTIIRIGELGEEMFIIGHGAVDIILKDGSVVASLHEGQFFGEAALLKETTRNANVRANTYCDLYRLDKEEFLNIIKEHPDLLENMEKVTKRRAADRPTPKKAS